VCSITITIMDGQSMAHMLRNMDGACIFHTTHDALALSIECPELAAAFSANAESSAKHSMQCKGSAGPGRLHSMLSADRAPSTKSVLLTAHK
jgi:hypothetical protein